MRLVEGERVDVRNHNQGWMVATVVALKGNQARVHYNGYKAVYDEWVEVEGLAPLGMKTGVRGMGLLLSR